MVSIFLSRRRGCTYFFVGGYGFVDGFDVLFQFCDLLMEIRGSSSCCGVGLRLVVVGGLGGVGLMIGCVCEVGGVG